MDDEISGDNDEQDRACEAAFGKIRVIVRVRPYLPGESQGIRAPISITSGQMQVQSD